MERELAVRNPRSGENDYTIQPPDIAELESMAAELRGNQAEWANAGIEHRCSVVVAWTEDLLDPASASCGELIGALATDTGRFLVSMVEAQSIRNIVMGWAGLAPMLLADSEERDSVTEGVGLFA